MSRRIGSGYVLHEILGSGASGTVWRGEGPDGPVAVKVLRAEFAGDTEIVLRFLRERELLTRLRHPHLVAVRDLVAEGDTLALVLELVEGPSLRAHLDQAGPLPAADAADTVAAVAEALHVVHEAGALHRDVKPENVLLGCAGNCPKLTDFGVALLADGERLTGGGGVVGTPDYAAPECASGLPPTPAVDVYAAGVLLYELLCGHTPFGAAHPVGVMHRHVHEEPAPIDGAPAVLWALIRRCLAKRPADRPDAADLARALRAAAAGLGRHSALAVISHPVRESAPAHRASVTHLRGGVTTGFSPVAVPAREPQAARRRRWPHAVAALGALAVLALAWVLALAGVLNDVPGRRPRGYAGPVYRGATGWLCTPWQSREPTIGGVSLRPCVLATRDTVTALAYARSAGRTPVDIELHLVRAGDPDTIVASGRCRLATGVDRRCGLLRRPLDQQRYFAIAVGPAGDDPEGVVAATPSVTR